MRKSMRRSVKESIVNLGVDPFVGPAVVTLRVAITTHESVGHDGQGGNCLLFTISQRETGGVAGLACEAGSAASSPIWYPSRIREYSHVISSQLDPATVALTGRVKHSS